MFPILFCISFLLNSSSVIVIYFPVLDYIFFNSLETKSQIFFTKTFKIAKIHRNIVPQREYQNFITIFRNLFWNIFYVADVKYEKQQYKSTNNENVL